VAGLDVVGNVPEEFGTTAHVQGQFSSDDEMD